MKAMKAFRPMWSRAVPISAFAILWAAGCREAASDGLPPPSAAEDDAAATSTGSAQAAAQGATAPGHSAGAMTSDSPLEAGVSKPSTEPSDAAALLPTDSGLPPGASQIAGIEFLQRIAGVWSGINSNTPLGFDFAMTVEFSPTGPSFVFGKYELDANDDVCWGFNIETYNGKTGLTFRNGGYLGGVLRDSRLQLMDYDTAKGTYHFCAVLESGLPVNGCSYIDATYTFSSPDHLLFVVTTMSGKPHVNWDATRTQTVTLPAPFPATVASQGDGSAPWPAAAGIPTRDF